MWGYRPATANPHLIINKQTAMEKDPVSGVWINRELRGQAATLERLRVPCRHASCWKPPPSGKTPPVPREPKGQIHPCSAKASEFLLHILQFG